MITALNLLKKYIDFELTHFLTTIPKLAHYELLMETLKNLAIFVIEYLMNLFLMGMEGKNPFLLFYFRYFVLIKLWYPSQLMG